MPTSPNSGALSGYLRILGKGQVNDAALVGWHRFECNRASCRSDSLRNPLCKVSDSAVASFLILLDIHKEVSSVSKLLTNEKLDDEPESLEALALPSDKKP